jgi:hypothetical protein
MHTVLRVALSLSRARRGLAGVRAGAFDMVPSRLASAHDITTHIHTHERRAPRRKRSRDTNRPYRTKPSIHSPARR